jgi:hypothetical protein
MCDFEPASVRSWLFPHDPRRINNSHYDLFVDGGIIASDRVDHAPAPGAHWTLT